MTTVVTTHVTIFQNSAQTKSGMMLQEEKKDQSVDDDDDDNNNFIRKCCDSGCVVGGRDVLVYHDSVNGSVTG